jgi:polysaccharide pyruvyl transferase WcaK-like protein
MVLEEDLTAKQLKGLIGRADFLIAERLHSIIGAIGVNTPFLNLASLKDSRIQGILVEQLNLKENIYYLNKPDVNSLFEKFRMLYENRMVARDHLKKVNDWIKIQLADSKLKIQEKMILDGVDDEYFN